MSYPPSFNPTSVSVTEDNSSEFNQQVTSNPPNIYTYSANKNKSSPYLTISSSGLITTTKSLTTGNYKLYVDAQYTGGEPYNKGSGFIFTLNVTSNSDINDLSS